MKAHYLGHVVFYVKNLQQSLAFYRDLLGFKEIGRVFDGTAAALTSGRTHLSCCLSRSVMPLGRHRAVAAGSIISVSKSGIIWMNCGPPSENWSDRLSRSTA